MQLYKLFFIFLLFTNISSICDDGSGSSAEECFNREFSKEERDGNAVICCLMSTEEGLKACQSVIQVTYDKILQGKKDFDYEGTPIEYQCKIEDKTTEKEKETETKTEKSSSASSYLALSLLILIFFGI